LTHVNRDTVDNTIGCDPAAALTKIKPVVDAESGM
jgi:hypothetical protein